MYSKMYLLKNMHGNRLKIRYIITDFIKELKKKRSHS